MTEQEYKIRLSKNFLISEYFSNYMCAEFSAWQLMRLIDYRLIEGMQLLRDAWGEPIIINNWYTHGVFQFSGYREAPELNNQNLWYRPFSYHSLGRAVDSRPANGKIKEYRQLVLSMQPELYAAGIRRMESELDSPTWVHLDTGETDELFKNQLLIFRK